MTPDFALSLSFDGISLLVNLEEGWTILEEVSLDHEHFEDCLVHMQHVALQIGGELFTSKLIIPNEQIRYLELPFPDDGRAPQDLIEEDLIANTPYALEDIVYDWEATEYGTIRAAAVARETLDEAESFALTHNFAPVYFVAVPAEGRFLRTPWFGPTRAVATYIDAHLQPKEDTHPITKLPLFWYKAPEALDHEVQEQVVLGAVAEDYEAAEAGVAMASEAGPQVALDTDIVVQDDPSAEFVTAHFADDGFYDTNEQSELAIAGMIGETVEIDDGGLAIDAEKNSEINHLEPVLFTETGDVVDDAVTPGVTFTSVRAVMAPVSAEPTILIEDAAANGDAQKESPAGAGVTKPVAPVSSIEALKRTKSKQGYQAARRRERRTRRLAAVMTGLLAAGLAAAAIIVQNYAKSPEVAIVETAPQPEVLQDLQAQQPPTADSEAVASNLAQERIFPPNQDNAPSFFPRDVEVAQAAPMERPMSMAPTMDVPQAVLFEDVSLTEDNTDSSLWIDDASPAQIASLPEITLASLEIAPIDIAKPILATPDIQVFGVPEISTAPTETENDTPTTVGAENIASSIETVSPVDESKQIAITSGPSRQTTTPGAALDAEQLALLRPDVKPIAEATPAPGQSDTLETTTPSLPEGKQPAIRPLLRPALLEPVPQEERAEETQQAESLAIETDLIRPILRPSNLPRVASLEPLEQTQRSSSPQQALVNIRRSTGGVAGQATQENALNLRKLNLIGVSGTAANRSALIRLSNGRYQKVKVGDRVDGGRVAAIGTSELSYVKSGRNIVLRMPKS